MSSASSNRASGTSPAGRYAEKIAKVIEDAQRAEAQAQAIERVSAVIKAVAAQVVWWSKRYLYVPAIIDDGVKVGISCRPAGATLGRFSAIGGIT
jgi:hypothetical protein